MTKTKLIYAITFLAIGSLVCFGFISGKWDKGVRTNKGFAVIELFTSEGCSSCPTADELVARIQKEYAGQPVYILAYHVDYWNRLGWKDAFSSPDFSKRQNDYASYLKLPSVYTPQIVVNGKTEFVGSQEGTLRNAIKSNLQNAYNDQLSLTSEKISHDEAVLRYSLATANKNVTLLIAVVQKSAHTKVSRGENQGRTLSHVQIVASLQKTHSAAKDGRIVVQLPKDFNNHDWEIIGFLQNTSDGSITGATVMNPSISQQP